MTTKTIIFKYFNGNISTTLSPSSSPIYSTTQPNTMQQNKFFLSAIRCTLYANFRQTNFPYPCKLKMSTLLKFLTLLFQPFMLSLPKIPFTAISRKSQVNRGFTPTKKLLNLLCFRHDVLHCSCTSKKAYLKTGFHLLRE